MVELDREKVFTEDPKPKHLWCMHCGRVYEYGKFRLVKGLQMCPYPDCDGDTVVDSWAWDDFRASAPDLYPEVPVIGEIYQEF